MSSSAALKAWATRRKNQKGIKNKQRAAARADAPAFGGGQANLASTSSRKPKRLAQAMAEGAPKSVKPYKPGDDARAFLQARDQLGAAYGRGAQRKLDNFMRAALARQGVRRAGGFKRFAAKAGLGDLPGL